ncbi:hypothetical protein BJ165DRAFT_1000165 [Panaeolus papilionaceus]|nr:hypothetical protein BJ165DRAFT_1000165 [Panaeolus papilionaceus]
MSLDFGSKKSNRRSILALSNSDTIPSLLDLSHSDIVPSQPGMQINLGLDVEANPNTEAEAVTEEERDPLYFCENILLKAEDRLFSVPRSGLIEHGTYFRSFLTPNQEITSGSVSDAGSSEKHPIVLDGVSKIDFHNLLRLIYPFCGIDPPSGDEHWLGILDLATRWGFHEIKETALTHLDHIFTSSSHYRDPVRALYLCQKYDIRQHIKHQYETLITSITPLDHLAMLAGGINEETILHLMQLREKWFCGMVWGEKGSKTGFGGLLPCRLSARKIVEDHFSGSGSLAAEDKAVEDTRIREEASRLRATVKHLEEMENVLIEAEREKRLVDAKAEAQRRAEEEAEKKRTEQEELARKKEAEASESPVQPNDDEVPSPEAADDDLDDIRSITSDMSIVPSPEVGPRVERLILLHAEKHDVLKQIKELECVGVDDNNPRMKKLRSVVQTYERKIQKYWECGE